MDGLYVHILYTIQYAYLISTGLCILQPLNSKIFYDKQVIKIYNKTHTLYNMEEYLLKRGKIEYDKTKNMSAS